MFYWHTKTAIAALLVAGLSTSKLNKSNLFL